MQAETFHVKEDLERNDLVGRAARTAVRRCCDRLGTERNQTAELLVTELATNALRHGRGAITLEIWIDARNDAHFTVSDQGVGGFGPASDPGVNGGFGLQLVDRLADHWSVGASASRVSFTLRRPET